MADLPALFHQCRAFVDPSTMKALSVPRRADAAPPSSASPAIRAQIAATLSILSDVAIDAFMTHPGDATPPDLCRAPFVAQVLLDEYPCRCLDPCARTGLVTTAGRLLMRVVSPVGGDVSITADFASHRNMVGGFNYEVHHG